MGLAKYVQYGWFNRFWWKFVGNVKDNSILYTSNSPTSLGSVGIIWRLALDRLKRSVAFSSAAMRATEWLWRDISHGFQIREYVIGWPFAWGRWTCNWPICWHPQGQSSIAWYRNYDGVCPIRTLFIANSLLYCGRTPMWRIRHFHEVRQNYHRMTDLGTLERNWNGVQICERN